MTVKMLQLGALMKCYKQRKDTCTIAALRPWSMRMHTTEVYGSTETRSFVMELLRIIVSFSLVISYGTDSEDTTMVCRLAI